MTKIQVLRFLPMTYMPSLKFISFSCGIDVAARKQVPWHKSHFQPTQFQAHYFRIGLWLLTR